MQGGVIAQIKLILEEIPESEKKIAQYIIHHPDKVIHMTINELASSSESSPAAVGRLCKSLGLEGFPKLKVNLSLEITNKQKTGYLDIEKNEKTQVIVEKTLQNTISVIQDTANIIDTGLIEAALELIHSAQKIYIYGIGASLLVALDVAQKWERVGKNIVATADRHQMVTSMAAGHKDGIFIGISYSGETRELLALTKKAKELGMKTIGLTKTGGNKLSQVVDLNLYTARAPEAILRSGATSSRFAQLFVLDILYFTYCSCYYDTVIHQLEETKRVIDHLYDS